MVDRRADYRTPVVLFLSLLACGPAKRHEVLDFFFDGVPPLTQERPDTTETKSPQKEEGPRVALPTIYEHPPHEEGICGACHSVPEDGTYSGKTDLLLPPNELCYECHDDFEAEKIRAEYAWVHGPVAAGECIACHGPHRTTYPSLLRHGPPGMICSRCHTEEILSPISEHEPGDRTCLDCHYPHYGPAKVASLPSEPDDETPSRER